MFCYKCGHQLPDKAVFCNKCGTKLFTGETQQQKADVTDTNLKSKNTEVIPVVKEAAPPPMPQAQPSSASATPLPQAQPSSPSAAPQKQNRSEPQFKGTQNNQSEFKQFVENYIAQNTAYRSSEELLNSKVPIWFAWLSYGIPFLLIVILGIVRSMNIGQVLLLAVPVSLIVGFCVSQLMASFRRNRFSMKSEVIFEEDIDIDDFKEFLNQNLSAQYPYFHQWERLTWTGGMNAGIQNEFEAKNRQTNLGAQFGSHSTILLARVTVGPYQLNIQSGKKSFYFTMINLVAGRADFSFKKYSYTFKVIPILGAAAEYYLKSRQIGSSSNNSIRQAAPIQTAEYTQQPANSVSDFPVAPTIYEAPAINKRSKTPIIIAAAVALSIAAVITVICIKNQNSNGEENIRPSAGASDVVLSKSLNAEGFSLKYPSGWNKIPNPSALVELSSPDGMANFQVIECYSDPFGVFTSSEAQVKKEVNAFHTFVKLWDTTIDGTSAKALTYKTDGLKGKRIVKNYWYYVGDDMYQIICSCEEAEKDSYDNILSEMVGSFSIDGNNAADTVANNGLVPNTTTDVSANKPSTSAPAPTTTTKTEPIVSSTTAAANNPDNTQASAATEPNVTSAAPSTAIVSIPYCIDCDKDRAAKMLQIAGFYVKNVYVYDDYTQKEYVVDMDPSGRTEAKYGSTVTLYISKGPAPVTVPKFIGLTSDEAETAAYENDITITWRYEYSDYADAGKIISQSISAGTEIEKYGTVELTVSKGVEDKKVEICGYNYSISSTESIYFWKASLTAADWDNIEKLENLTELTLTECGGIDLNRIGKLGKLKKLSLCWDNIRDISPLKNMTNLTSLELAGNEISDLSPLKNLTNLVFLGLSNNSDITDAEVSKILHLIGLTELDLRYTSIHDIKPIVALKNLKYFSFTGNNISQADVSWFTEQLPDCQIRW